MSCSIWREIESESQAEKSGDQEQDAPPRQGQERERQIAGDADGGDGNVVDDGEGAVVHDAAVPRSLMEQGSVPVE